MNCKTQVLGRFRIFSFLSFVVLCGCLMGGGQLAIAASDPCNSPTVGGPAGSVGSDSTGACSAVITVTAVDNTGNAIAFNVAVTGQPAYDGFEDILVGIQNNSGANLKSIVLSSPDTTDGGIFFFDGDGPCSLDFHPNTQYPPYSWCPSEGYPVNSGDPNPVGYEGPHNNFSASCTTANNQTTCTSGTVNFAVAEGDTGIPAGGSTWFALEGTPESIGGMSVTESLTTTTTQFIIPTPGATTIQTIDYTNSGTDPTSNGGTLMRVTFLPITDSAFQNLVAGTPFQGSHCMQQDTGNGNFSCAVTIALCKRPTDATFAGLNCPQAADTSPLSPSIIGVKIKYSNNTFIDPSQVLNPGYLTATDNALGCTNDTANTCRKLQNIFTLIQNDCCTTSGGTKSFNSLFVPVSDLPNPTYGFTGFFQPIDNIPVVNSVKAGSAVPVKFSLGGNFGLNIFAGGAPGSGPMTCNATAPVDTIEQTVAAGNSSLSYDPTSNQYTYVWKTQSAWANTCRQLVVNFADGSTKRANFLFKK
jgi:hypothetical protein